jgi:hypothetical protein
MSKTMKSYLIRIVSMLLVTALGMGVVFYTAAHGTRRSGLFYGAAGICPDAQLITVNGTTVSAEEYLYWLSYDCEYLSQYVSDIDWDGALNDSTTYGDYAKYDALETVKLYVVLRQWAAENGITLSAEDQAQLDAQKAQYVAYYGSEEAYRNQIQLLGVTEKTFDAINSSPYLYSSLYAQFCDSTSKLYPGSDALTSFCNDKGYVSFKEIYLSTSGLDDTAKAAKRAQAADIAAQLQSASDVQATFNTLCSASEDTSYTDNPNGLTMLPSKLDESLATALNALGENQASGVVETDDGCYVLVRIPLFADGALSDYFNDQLSQKRTDAVVKTSKAYDKLSVAAFYPALIQGRTALEAVLGPSK